MGECTDQTLLGLLTSDAVVVDVYRKQTFHGGIRCRQRSCGPSISGLYLQDESIVHSNNNITRDSNNILSHQQTPAPWKHSRSTPRLQNACANRIKHRPLTRRRQVVLTKVSRHCCSGLTTHFVILGLQPACARAVRYGAAETVGCKAHRRMHCLVP